MSDVVPVAVDNYEAMCVAPRLPGDDTVLVLLVNDDNLNPDQIGTQFVLLALHASPLDDRDDPLDHDAGMSDLSLTLLGLSAGIAFFIAFHYLCRCCIKWRKKQAAGELRRQYSNISIGRGDGSRQSDSVSTTPPGSRSIPSPRTEVAERLELMEADRERSPALI